MAQRTPMAERILQAADRLFYSKGIRAVGVDAIAAEAGISKRSLYDTFASKDALVEAYLLRHFRPLPEPDAPVARQVMGLFAELQAHFANEGYRGCPFVNAVTEMGDDCRAARQLAVKFKTERLRHVREQLAAAGAHDPADLAEQIGVLIEGAIASMLVRGDPAIATTAANAARVLMQAGGVPVHS